MNQNGWGLYDMILWCTCLVIILIIIGIGINKNINSILNNNDFEENADTQNHQKEDENKEKITKTYDDYLEMMITSSKKYISSEYANDYKNADYLKLSINFLVNNSYLEKIMDIKDNKIECIGYVSITYNNEELIYKPFLKCGNNYESEDFVERNAE